MWYQISSRTKESQYTIQSVVRGLVCGYKTIESSLVVVVDIRNNKLEETEPANEKGI
jgi:hypothetical protein